MRRAVLWTVVVLTALVLQSTVFAQISLGGTKGGSQMAEIERPGTEKAGLRESVHFNRL